MLSFLYHRICLYFIFTLSPQLLENTFASTHYLLSPPSLDPVFPHAHTQPFPFWQILDLPGDIKDLSDCWALLREVIWPLSLYKIIIIMELSISSFILKIKQVTACRTFSIVPGCGNEIRNYCYLRCPVQWPLWFPHTHLTQIAPCCWGLRC